ncbi:hypothetical protein GC209_08685 [bacterium]|nr:hypothetical protein [bacterium]
MPSELHDQILSDFALLRVRNSKRLVVALSGMNTAPGRYSYYSSFAEAECDTLLLNCPDNGWYFGGLPFAKAHGDFDLKSTLSFLERIVARYDQVLFVGGSMGAYGALLYGAHFPGAEILSMSPEIYPGIRRGFVIGNCRSAELPPNLSRLFAKPDFNPYIIAGEKRYSDLFCLSDAPLQRTFALRNAQHLVPVVLHRYLGALGKVVDPIFSGDLGKILRPLAGNLLAYPEIVALLYLMELGKIPVARARDQLGIIPPDNYLRGYLALLISEIHERTGQKDRALEFARMARDANLTDLPAHFAHDRLTLELEGAPPEPIWRAYQTDHFTGQPLYDSCVRDLMLLHGDLPADEALTG